ncbi:MAG: hypothetical protein AB7T06_29285 [Kofleriaceae bacterium]
MATTVEHLHTAIYEMLTTATGRMRALEADEIFNQGFPPGFPPDLRSVASRDGGKRGSAFVAIGQVQPMAGSADEVGSIHLYQINVTISRDYYLGEGWDASDVRASMVRVADDYMRVREALCWPENLRETVGSVATGLDELVAANSQSRVRVEMIGSGRDRLLNAQDVFLGVFSKTVA